MSKSSEAVKKWRHTTKKRIIDSMGGCCQICGYNKCESALALHHIDPDKKELSFGAIRSNPKNWSSIVEELKKCILLCHNCHSEIHSNMVELPKVYKVFDEGFTEYKQTKDVDLCPVCGKDKFVSSKYCSLSCSSRSKFRVDWDNIDLLKLLENDTIVNVAEKLNISDTAVRKRLKKINSGKPEQGAWA